MTRCISSWFWRNPAGPNHLSSGQSRSSTGAGRSANTSSIEGRGGAPDVLALLVLGQPERLDPSPSVATDVDAVLPHRLGNGRVAFEGERAGEKSECHLPLVEQALQAPEPDPGAVLEHRLGREIALAARHRRPRHFGEADFGEPVAIPDQGLGPFLVVDDEVEGERRPARHGGDLDAAGRAPARNRRCGADRDRAHVRSPALPGTA